MGYYGDMHVRILEAKPWHDDTCQCLECRYDRAAQQRIARMEFSNEPRAEAGEYRVGFRARFGQPYEFEYAKDHSAAYRIQKRLRADNWQTIIQYCRNGIWQEI